MSNSYRQILRSSSIIGGASAINILVGLLRTKVVAILLGPAGVGLIGLFTNLIATASTIAGLGMGSVGTRQIAEASAADEPQRVAIARRALFIGTLGLAILGAGVFLMLRHLLAHGVLDDAAPDSEIGWLAIAVALTIAASSQNALLNGLRRIGDIARVSIGSALLCTVVGIAALSAWGRAGVVVYVIAAPLATFALGHWYVMKLPRAESARPGLAALGPEWRMLASLGFAFMLAGLADTAGQLAVRTLVQRRLGLEALGHFQASWAISMTYIGFVLGAMGTDYYPRLTAVIRDHDAVNRMVNQQTEVALLLASPVLLLMLGCAPWVVHLLYSSAFDEAVVVLRWQVLGDVLKIASWPLGIILLASGAGKAFIVTEWIAMAFFVGITALLLPMIGIQATGMSFLGMYAAHLLMVLWLARRRTQFAWSRPVLLLLPAVLFSGVAVVLISRVSSPLAAWVGSAAALTAGLVAVVRLAGMVDPSSRIGAMLGKLLPHVPGSR